MYSVLLQYLCQTKTLADIFCLIFTQFEIIKFRKGNDDKDLSVNGKCPYFRILIRRKKAEPIVEVETTDNVSVNEVEQNDVQPTNNVEVAKDNTTSNEVYTPTRRPHSDEDVRIDSLTIENGTEIANKHNTRRGVKNKSINLNNSTNDIADKNLPP